MIDAAYGSAKYAAYGSIGAILGGKPSPAKLGQEVSVKTRPAFPVLVGCLFVPWLLFATTFWLRSFEVRRDSESFAIHLGYCLLVPVFVFAWMTFNLARTGDPKAMAFLTATCVLSWAVASVAGDWNYHSFMRPYYDIKNLNTYPSVDPAKYQGTQLMDAGIIQFTPGSTLMLGKSIGFKNEDIYCVAPIASGPNSNQSTYDFWAVGLNCCSGHSPDFRCGEYTNPQARWGLRLMDDSKKNMFRLAVQEATATFNLNAPHPVFMYWLSDPSSEVNAYQEDGYNYFLMFVFGAFSVQLFLVLFSVLLLTSL